MSEAAPPAWARKRDGRLVPFDADLISRSLFATTEAIGRPDAFLARELADGVVHFLTTEEDGSEITTSRIAETVIGVVRELGQPALAMRYEEHRRRRQKGPQPARPEHGEMVFRIPASRPLADVLTTCREMYTLQTVFTRDLAAAHTTGLLTLTGLQTPDELAGYVVQPLRAQMGLDEAIDQARQLAGELLVLDGLEYLPDGDVLSALKRSACAGGPRWVVNLNCVAPPPWADESSGGPLFSAHAPAGTAEAQVQRAEQLLVELLRKPDVRIDWHLSERDFVPDGAGRLARLARHALDGAALAFIFDRPRRQITLAEGLGRSHPAVLLTVGLHLPQLAEQPGAGDPKGFLRKLGSLVRLALSAAVQKRDYLRRQDRLRQPGDAGRPALTAGFLLDRARLVVTPVGLDAVVQRFCSRTMASGGAALDMGREIVQRLRQVLWHEGRLSHLEICLDGPWTFDLGEEGRLPDAAHAAGLTPWDATAPVKGQLRAAGILQAIAEGGLLALFTTDNPTPEEAAAWLRAAWQQPEIARVRFLRTAPRARQLAFDRDA
jgi:hypothetical protein